MRSGTSISAARRRRTTNVLTLPPLNRSFRERVGILSPELPARHPRRCRRCGRLYIPDRSRRFTGRRAELVDALGIQATPGVGINVSPGQGILAAQAADPCCCAECVCPYCPQGRPRLVNLMISGLRACFCFMVFEEAYCTCGSILAGYNGSWVLQCNTAFAGEVCKWTGPVGIGPDDWQAIFDEPNTIFDEYGNFVRNECIRDDGGCINTFILGMPIINLNILPGGVLELGIIIGGHKCLDSGWVPYTAPNFPPVFYARATTTEANACSLADPVTFTNLYHCPHPITPSSFFDGTAVVSAA
jgi:hypothetical protein